MSPALPGRPAAMVTVTRELADRIADVAQLLTDDEIPDEALRRLTSLGVELVPCGTAVAPTIATDGGALTFAASDQRLDELHRLEFDDGEGRSWRPCVITSHVGSMTPRPSAAGRRSAGPPPAPGSAAAWHCRCAPTGSRRARWRSTRMSRTCSAAPRTTSRCSLRRRGHRGAQRLAVHSLPPHGQQPARRARVQGRHRATLPPRRTSCRPGHRTGPPAAPRAASRPSPDATSLPTR